MTKNPDKIESSLLYLLYILLGLMVLLPLFVSYDFYFPFVTLRSFSFRFMIEFGMLLLLALSWKNKTYLPQFNSPIMAIILFISIMFVADLRGENTSEAIWGNFERMDGLASLIHFLGLTLIASCILKTKKQWALMAHCSLVIALVVGMIGLCQLISDPGLLINSTMGNSSYLAIYSVFHIFIAALFAFSLKVKQNKKLLFFYVSLIIFFLLVVYNTGSRGSFVAIIAGSFITLLTMGQLKNYIKPILLFFLTLIILLTGLWAAKNTNFVKNNKTLNRIVDFKSGSNTRSQLWRVALMGIKERPILGIGQENFDSLFDKYYPTTLGDAEDWFDRTHNTLLDWTVAGGILGGISYLLIFILTLSHLWKKNELRIEKAIITGVITAYFVYNMFIFDNLVSSVLFFFMIAYISLDTTSKKNYSTNKKMFALISFLSLFFIFNFFFINLPAFKAADTLGKSIYVSRIEKDKSYQNIKNLLKENTLGKREIQEQLLLLTYSQFSEDSEKINFALNELSNYPSGFKKSYLNLLMIEQNKNDDHTLMDKYFQAALVHSPKRQIAYYKMVRFYLSKNDYKNALAFAKAAYELDPQINRSKVAYALCSIFNNNIEISDALLQNVALDTYVNNPLFFEAYATLNRKDKMIGHLKKIIKVSPDNPDTHTKLGMLYSEMGNEIEAANEFKQAQEITQKILSSKIR